MHEASIAATSNKDHNTNCSKKTPHEKSSVARLFSNSNGTVLFLHATTFNEERGCRKLNWPFGTIYVLVWNIRMTAMMKVCGIQSLLEQGCRDKDLAIQKEDAFGIAQPKWVSRQMNIAHIWSVCQRNLTNNSLDCSFLLYKIGSDENIIFMWWLMDMYDLINI